MSDFSGFEKIYNDIASEKDESCNTNNNSELINNNKNEEINNEVGILLLENNEEKKDFFDKNNIKISKEKDNKENDYRKGHRHRVREKFLNNPDSFNNTELLELFLFFIIPRVDVKPLSYLLLKKFKNLSGVFNAKKEEIENIGLKYEKFHCAYLTMIRIINEIKKEENIKTNFKNINDVADYCMIKMLSKKEEEFHIIFFDNDMNMICDKYFGLSHQSFVALEIKNIIEEIVSLKATKIIIYHNHPHGDIRPTNDDVVLTDKVKKSVEVLDVKLLDHLIITNSNYFSFKKNGLLQNI